MFTEQQLKAMIRREPVSDRYPYLEQDDVLLEQSLQPLLDDMTQANIRYNVSNDHFGCGYASYIQIVCWTDQFAKMVEKDGQEEEDRRGLFILISRLAPVAAIVNDAWQFASLDEFGKDTNVGGTMPINPELTIDNKYKPLAKNLSRLLLKHHLTPLQKKFVDKPLPFDEKIRTSARPRGQYLVWDAIFYWDD
ncbi:MAG: hypothetical protein UHX00_07435 [Caryophanon sp.]|nr:hypothetical protein [Caryophanon sp.]